MFTAGQWISTVDSYRIGVDLTYAEKDRLDLQYFQQSGQWQVVEPVEYVLSNRTFKDLPFFVYDTIEYTFVLKRHPTFYVTVILIPSMLLGFLSPLVFLLPVESGEKISLGITILLALTVELLVLSDILPPSTADDFPIVGTFVIFLIILMATSCIVSVIITAIYHAPPCKNVPNIIVKLLQCRFMDIVRSPKLLGFEEDKGSKVVPESKESSSTIESREETRKEKAKQRQFEINCVGWKLLASLIDRIVLVCYTISLVTGSLYYFLQAKFGS